VNANPSAHSPNDQHTQFPTLPFMKNRLTQSPGRPLHLSTRSICRSSIAAFLGLMSCTALHAQLDLFWDADGDPSNGLGGSGIWNNAPGNLTWNDDGFAPNLPWTDTTGVDRANFAGLVGTVSLGAPITANQLLFSANGFIVDNGGAGGNTLTLAGIGAAIQVTNAGETATVSAAIAGSGLTKTGNGTLVLSGTNLYSGSTTISGGILSIAAPTNLGDGSATNTVVLNAGTLRGSASLDLGVNRSINLGAAGGTLSTPSGTTMTVSGTVIGSNPLGISGGGTVVLSANNAGFDGDVNVDSIGGTSTNMTLRLSNANALLSGTVNLTAGTVAGAQGTTLDLAGVSISADVTLSMNSTFTGNFRSALASSAGTSVWNGPVIMNGNNLNQFFANAGALTVNGNIDAGGGGFTGTLFLRGANAGVINGIINLPGGNVAKTDSGTWTINQPGTWANTQVSVGTVRIGTHNALPATTTLTMGQNDNNNSTLDLNGFHQTVGALALSSTGGTKSITNLSGAALSTFTVNNTVDSTYGGVLGGNLALTKTGPGTLTLTNTANTFTGNVVIDGGMLAFPGQGNADATILGAGSKTITLNNNAILRPTTNSDPNVAGGKGFVIGATGGQFDIPTGVTFTLNDGLANGSAVDQLSGPGLLTKTGPGTLTLGLATGFPNRTGNTLVTGGTLQVSNNLGSGRAR
jgi:autotransporter-associated beta strand protein